MLASGQTNMYIPKHPSFPIFHPFFPVKTMPNLLTISRYASSVIHGFVPGNLWLKISESWGVWVYY